MLRFTPLAALVAGLVLAVPSAARVGGDKIAFGSDDGIYTVNADGSGLARVRPGGYVPRWSPDGSQIAVGELGARLYVINEDGTGARLIEEGLDALLSRQPWSPYGTQLAFVGREAGTGRYNIYVASVSGGAIRQLTFNAVYKQSVVWSPNSSRLVYSQERSQTWSDLFLIDAGGGAPTQITPSTPGQVKNLAPAWSPDGRTIAFARSLGGVAQAIYTIHPDGTELHQVWADSGAPAEPSWSPDGALIAFSTSKNSPYSPYGTGREIFSVNADGSRGQRLTYGGPRYWNDGDPAWSAGGQQLVFARGTELYTMNADGTCESELATGLRGWTAQWQPVSGMPADSPKSCHAVAVEGSAIVGHLSSGAEITATVVNSGTQTLTDINFAARAPNDVTLTFAEVESALGSCSVRYGRVDCSIPSIPPGESARVWIRAEARRVTQYNDPKEDVSLRTRLRVTASDQLLDTGRESDTVRFLVDRCTTRTGGGGRIQGSPFADELCGRRGNDWIEPEDGRDTVHAGAGRDQVFSVDDRRDRISCGPGFDRVVADSRDLVARDCERVRRR